MSASPGKKGESFQQILEKNVGTSTVCSNVPSPLQVLLNSPKAAFCSSICYAWFRDQMRLQNFTTREKSTIYTIKLYLVWVRVCVWGFLFASLKKVEIPLFSFYSLRELLNPTVHSHGNVPWPRNYFIPSYSEMHW